MPLCTITMVNGVGTFLGTLRSAGPQTFTATDTTTPTITGTSEPVDVEPGPADSFEFTTPATVTSGTSFTFTLEVKDEFGNRATAYEGTVQFTSSDGGAILPGDYVFTGGDAGLHTFTNLTTMGTAGTQTLTATDSVTPAITNDSDDIEVEGDTIIFLTNFALGVSSEVLNGKNVDIGGGQWSEPQEFIEWASAIVRHLSGADARAVADVTAPAANGTVRLVITTGSTVGDVSFGVVFNAATGDAVTDACWIARFSGATDTIKLIYWNGSSEVEKASVSFDVEASTEYEIDVVVNGDDVNVYVDGNEEVDYTEGSRPGKTNVYAGFEMTAAEGSHVTFSSQTDSVSPP